MAGCCSIEAQTKQKKNILIAVLIINAVMFIVQFTAAFYAHSTSLLADSLDMLGDMLTYAVSLYAVNRGTKWLARAAIFKGSIMTFFGLMIFIEAGIKVFYTDVIPHSGIMAVFSILGLLANGVCLYLLTHQRNADINMSSTWICARNDIIGNVSVLFTAGLVFMFHSRWPDIVVGLGLALVILISAKGVLRSAIAQLKQ